MLLLSLALSAASAQTLPCADTAGQTVRYEFAYSATQARGTTAFHRTFEVGVVQSETPIALTWRSVDAEVEQVREGVAAAATQAIVTTDLPVLQAKVAVDATPPTVTFTNMADAAAALREPVHSALQANLAAMQPPPEVDIAPLVEAVVSEEVLQKSLESYLLPIYTYGCQALPGGTSETSVTLPNPLGGEPFPAVRTLTVGAPAPDGTVSIHDHTALTDAIMAQLATQFGIDTSQSEQGGSMLDIHSDTTLVLDADGFPNSWTIDQHVGLLGQSASETTTVERVVQP